jgi:SSS family transporter
MRFLIPLLFAVGFAIPLHALESTAVDDGSVSAPILLGRVGAYAGTVDGALVTAGGVQNGAEPDAMILVTETGKDGKPVSRPADAVLPTGRAYGASVSTEDAFYLIGGAEGPTLRPIADCCKITRDKGSGTLRCEPVPPLPVPMVGASAGYLTGVIYVAGADDTGAPRFLKYDTKAATPAWEELEPYPGPGRLFAPGMVQNISAGKAFFLFGGIRAPVPSSLWNTGSPDDDSDGVEMLSDALLYDFQTKSWRELVNADAEPFAVTGSSATCSGTIHIVFPGAGGILPAGARLSPSPEVRVYNTITNKYFLYGELAGPPAGQGAFWNGHITLPLSLDDGVVLSSLTLEEQTNRLSKLNQAIIVAYFLFLIAASLYFLGRMKGTDDFFRGGCRIPWWALGISIYGTITSAITYITVPAKSFMTNWCYFLLAVGPFVAVPLLIRFYIPKISRFNFTSAYEYLEYRFHFSIRILGSVIFIVFQVMRIAILLFLPSIALNAITGIDIKTCIIGVGVAGIFCTLMGGLEIVVWIEVIQIFTLLVGFVLTLVVMVWRFDGSFFDMLRIAYADGKFHLYDATPDFHLPTLWVVLIASFFLYIIPYASDQTILQRYFAGKDNKARSRGVWISLGLMVPNLLLLFLAGTLFYVFYKENPKELLVTMNNNDSLMPWFFVSQLPNGISGLLLLALFTSAMSSVSSGINAISATYTIDFHERIFRFSRDHALGAARVVTLVSGACGVLFALAMATWDIASLWDQYNMFIGLVSSSLAGIFFLGVFCKRANTPGTLIGLFAGCLLQYYIAKHQVVHLLLYSGTGVTATFLIGWLASYAFPPKVLPDQS